jgi:hypothetical protein
MPVILQIQRGRLMDHKFSIAGIRLHEAHFSVNQGYKTEENE